MQLLRAVFEHRKKWDLNELLQRYIWRFISLIRFMSHITSSTYCGESFKVIGNIIGNALVIYIVIKIE